MNAKMRRRRRAGSCERNSEAESNTRRGRASSPEGKKPRRMAGLFDEARLQVGVEEGRQLRLGQGAHLGGLDVAVLEQHQRRDATHAVLGRGFLVVVDVRLAYLELVLVGLGDLVLLVRDNL